MNTSGITMRQCDLLVVGSGASGLSAAVTAAWHGLEVIVVEKDDALGGEVTRVNEQQAWSIQEQLSRRRRVAHGS